VPLESIRKPARAISQGTYGETSIVNVVFCNQVGIWKINIARSLVEEFGQIQISGYLEGSTLVDAHVDHNNAVLRILGCTQDVSGRQRL
jgi:hypothetical protein